MGESGFRRFVDLPSWKLEGSGSVAGEAAEDVIVRRGVLRAWSWKARGVRRLLRGRDSRVALDRYSGVAMML